MFTPFSPHFVSLKHETIKDLISQKILTEGIKNIFPVICMDVKSEKRNMADKPKPDEDEDEIVYTEVEVTEIMLLIGITGYGYYWVDQNETIFLDTSKPILR